MPGCDRPAGRSSGTLTATGLPAAVADGLMCVDAVQFAEPPLAALPEFRRLLAPGARLVLTCWEAAGPSDEQVSPRIRAVNLRRDLPAAGFAGVQVHDKPGWREAERRMWQEVLSAPTRRSGRCKPRAGARWTRSNRCAACSRAPPHPEPGEGTKRPGITSAPS
ncbi:MAG TPA: hypothetical protein VMV92_37045 [Streptosporangiaceae bacterium]|nr:hypothetical protein [Streptosporangiaceae bacterium]